MAAADFSATAKDMFFSPATALYAAYEAGGQLRNVEQLLQYDLCLRNTGNYIYGMHWVVFNRLGENLFEKYHCTDFEDIEVALIRGMLKEVADGNGPLYADYSKLPSTSTTEGEGFNQGILMKKRVALSKFIRSLSDGDVLGKPEVSLLARVATRPLRADLEGKTTVDKLWAVGFISMCGTAHGSWVHGDGVGNAARTALRTAASIASEIDQIELEEVDIDQVQKFKDRIYEVYDYTGEKLPYRMIHYLSRLICMPENSVNKTEETMNVVLEDLADLRAHFRPEFLNRLDEIILFKPLTKDNIGNIIHLLIADVNRRLADKELQVRLTDAAESYITEHGFDPMYGARPLKRYVQKTVETLAAKLILKGDINTGDDIVIDVVNGELTARAEGRKAIEEK